MKFCFSATLSTLLFFAASCASSAGIDGAEGTGLDGACVGLLNPEVTCDCLSDQAASIILKDPNLSVFDDQLALRNQNAGTPLSGARAKDYKTGLLLVREITRCELRSTVDCAEYSSVAECTSAIDNAADFSVTPKGMALQSAPAISLDGDVDSMQLRAAVLRELIKQSGGKPNSSNTSGTGN